MGSLAALAAALSVLVVVVERHRRQRRKRQNLEERELPFYPALADEVGCRSEDESATLYCMRITSRWLQSQLPSVLHALTPPVMP